MSVYFNVFAGGSSSPAGSYIVCKPNTTVGEIAASLRRFSVFFIIAEGKVTYHA
jgi:hypothetical protein